MAPDFHPRLVFLVSTIVLLSLPLLEAPPALAHSTYIPVDLSLTVFRDGSVDIQYSVRMLQPSTTIPLPNFDPYSTSSLLVEDANNRTVPYAQNLGVVTVNASSGAIVTFDYKTFSVTTKAGDSWTVKMNSPISWSVTFPLNSTITGFSTTPQQIQQGTPSFFVMPQGVQWIIYRLSPPEAPPPPGASIFPTTYLLLAAGMALLGAPSYLLYRRYRWKVKGRWLISGHETLNPEEKRILMLLVDKRGKALEADVAKLLGLPRTTAWRHVRNLEEEGIVVTEKIGSQNLVRLKS